MPDGILPAVIVAFIVRKMLGDPLVNRGDGELASFLQRVLYQFRVREGWLFWAIGSCRREISAVDSVGGISCLIRVLSIHRRIFVTAMSSPDVVGVIGAVRPRVRFILVA